jgi:hypothetical protein
MSEFYALFYTFHIVALFNFRNSDFIEISI